MMLYISMKFHEIYLERLSHEITIVEFQIGITPKHVYMLLYISMKFHENILKGFQVTEQNEMTIVKFQRGITTKLQTKVTVLVLSTSSDDALCFHEVS